MKDFKLVLVDTADTVGPDAIRVVQGKISNKNIEKLYKLTRGIKPDNIYALSGYKSLVDFTKYPYPISADGLYFDGSSDAESDEWEPKLLKKHRAFCLEVDDEKTFLEYLTIIRQPRELYGNL